jgi:hypothetical protein
MNQIKFSRQLTCILSRSSVQHRKLLHVARREDSSITVIELAGAKQVSDFSASLVQGVQDENKGV